MLDRQGQAPSAIGDDKMAALFRKHLDQVAKWLAEQPNVQVLYVRYDEVLAEPRPHMDQINRLLGTLSIAQKIQADLKKVVANKGLEVGVGFDGSSIPGYVSIHESDMVMKLDVSTFAVLPRYFYDKAVVSFICDIFKPDGKRFEGDTRHVLTKKVESMRSEGYVPRQPRSLNSARL
jgi:glutamine synthetase